MTISIKDIIYLIAYFVTMIAGFLTFRARLKNLELTVQAMKEIIYGDKGCLNVIDSKTCGEHRDHVYLAISRSEKAMESAEIKLDKMNSNLIKIMIHLKIDPLENGQFKQ